MSEHQSVTAAVLVIGDEVLSGCTKDSNSGYIAEYLTAVGIDLREVRVVPETKNFFEKLMEESTGDKDPHRVLMGEKLSLAQLALPYLKNFDPQRVSAVMRALEMVDALQDEKVMLITPAVLLQN